MTILERPHGYAKYRIEKCRCTTCRRAVSQYNRRHAMALTAGTWCPYIDAEPVRQHTRQLMASGIGWRRVAALAGVAPTTIKQLLYGKPGRGPTTRIRPAIAQQILSITSATAEPAAGTNIAAIGTQRRIQAMACLGWTLTEQARRIGWNTGNYHSILERPQIVRATEAKIRALYDELSMAVAPAGYGATRVKNLARVKGWLPPLAWDDDTIDDPAARPKGALRRAAA